MSFLVTLVVDNPDLVGEILTRWEHAGAPGVTIFNSTGLGHMRRAGLRDDLPLIPSLQDLLAGEEVMHRTLMAVVDDQATVDRLVAATQDVTGDLDEPRSGFLFVVPVLQVYGMGKHRTDRSRE